MNIQVRAIANLASAKFSQSDDGHLFASEKPGRKEKAGFRQIGKFVKDRHRIGQAKRIPQNDSQQLPPPVCAHWIEIARIRA